MRGRPAPFARAQAQVAQPAADNSLRRILRQARASGALSLAGRGLQELPELVLRIAETLEEDERWFECVDTLKLDLSHNSLSALPAGLPAALPSLQRLKASNNALRAEGLPRALFEWADLRTLDLASNALEGAFPPALGRLSALVELVLAHNRLAGLPEELAALGQLQVLRLEHNALRRLPEALPPRLRELTAGHNALEALPRRLPAGLRLLEVASNALPRLDGLEPLAQLTILDARENRLGAMPRLPAAGALSQVFLGYNGIAQLPPGALDGAAASLAHLDLSNNRLRELPEEGLGALAALKTLDLANNELHALPAALGYLRALNRLAVDGNPLRAIRRGVVSAGCNALKKYLRSRGAPPPGYRAEDFDQVDDHLAAGAAAAAGPDVALLVRSAGASGELSLRGADITALPPEAPRELTALDVSGNARLAALPTRPLLRRIRAEGCALEALPAALFDECPALEELEVRKNRLARLPERLPEGLRLLDARNNALTALPAPLLAGLPRLRALLLGYNRLPARALDGLPWREATALEELDVSNNRIESVAALAELTWLRTLDFSNNDVREIPPQLSALSQLRALVFSGNPQRTVRTHIAERGVEAVLQFLADRMPAQPPPPAADLPFDERPVGPSAGAVASAQSLEVAQLDMRIDSLQQQLDDPALSQAKRYAVKKEVARVKAARIRVLRRK